MRRFSFTGGVGAAGLMAVALACGGADQTLDDVRALQDSGAYAETLAPLRELLEKNPSDPEANYRLGLALVNTGRGTAAVFPLKRAAADPSMTRQAGLLLATTFSQMRNYEEAIAAADQVLEQDPDNEAALFVKTQAALGAADAARALEAAKRLAALQPDDPGYQSLVAGSLMSLGRHDEAEKILLGMEGKPWPNDPSGEGKTCFLVANFYGRFRGGAERALPKIKECLARYAETDVSLLPIAAESYDEIHRADEATALMQRALERMPEDQGLRLALAKRTIARGDRAGGDKMMEDVARTTGNPKSWQQLAGARRTRGEHAAALAALDEALALTPDSQEVQFFRADVLVDLGRLDEARAIAEKMEEPTFARVLRGRLALEDGNPKEALSQLGPAIEQWPTNAGARLLAAQAAYELGDEARAISELREATRSEPGETDAALLLARLQYARGEYDQSAEFAWRHINQRGAAGAPAAHQIGAWSQAARGQYDKAREFLEQLRKLKSSDFSGVALAEEAKLVAREKDRDAAIRVLRGASADLGKPGYEVALRYLVDLERDAGRADDAFALVQRLAAAQPGSASLQALRGDLLLAAGDAKQAAGAYEAALRADPASTAALAGQARLARAEGRTADAVALYDRATSAGTGNAQYEYEAAQALLASGDDAGARKRLEEVVRRHPEHAGAANDLAWLLAAKGEDLERAARLAEAASRQLDGPEALDTLGVVRLRRGEVDEAVATFQRVLEAQPRYATARYHLGLALAQKGRREDALAALRAALESGPFPEAEEARTELAKLEGGAR
jgi:tetratricopeptide (TPR) repeat protein